MSLMNTVIDGYRRNLDMVKANFADFSDEDMMARPVPTANHANWQVGHLVVSETRLVGKLPKAPHYELPAGFAEKYTKETAALNDPKAFATKADLIALYEQVRGKTIEWLKVLSPEDLASPSPEGMARAGATVGHIVLMIPSHMAMHIGQFQVTRRKLNKPFLF